MGEGVGTEELARGEHIYVSRKLRTYSHHGIDCGDGTVIHFTGEPGFRKTGASVARTPIADFAPSSRVRTRQHRKHSATEVVVARAESQLEAKGYNIAFNNCEHFAYWCCTGVNKSRQVQNVAAAITQTPGPLVVAPAAVFVTLGALFVSRKLRGIDRRQ